jgi:hypothetical protein
MMTGTLERRPAAARRSAPEQLYTKRARWTRARLESAIVFAVAFLAFLLLGWWTTLHLHVVPGDGISRLAHGYFVFWNDPAKLAAIGFVWPPLITLAFLPLVVVKPVATSLWALPIMSSVFGAALLVTLQHTLRVSGMRFGERLTLVVLFALNPMVAFYSSNGMSEVVGWWLLTLAVAAFVRWDLESLPRRLIVTGSFLALAALARYELVLWAGVVVAAVAAKTWRRSHRLPEFEASAIAVLAPVVYALGVWSFLNWTILGNAFAWLHEETTQTFGVYAESGPDFGRVTVANAARVVFSENLRMFPLVLVAAVVVAVVGVARRAIMGLALAAMLLLNALLTVVLAVKTQAPHLFELRLNVRPLPLVVLAAGWLYSTASSGLARRVVWAAAAAGLALSIPLSWHTMRTFPFRLDEAQFASALATGRDQAHKLTGVDAVADRRMAEYILRHVHRQNSVLTDDVQTFGVMLASGRPSLFVDRIDHGDARWFEIANAPERSVDYLLMSWIENDLLRTLYPRVYDHGGRDVELVYATRTGKLFRITGPLR